MKKICLITYTRSPNYGAALQLYATYKALEQLGGKVTVLDYQNQFESQKRGLRFILSGAGIKEVVREYVGSYVFGVKNNAKRNFGDFYNQMHYSKRIKSINELMKTDEFDVLCVGSDQVWNPRITNGYDDVFTLNIQTSSRKISYASSMGSCNFEEYPDRDFLNAIDKFDRISVREEVARQYLCNRISKPIKKVVDPTLLIGEEGWNKAINENDKGFQPNEKYVLVYALGGYFESNLVLAQKVARMIGAKVYAITLSNRRKNVDKIITDASPLDFVRLVRDASFVVTNSFHGTCFSIIMKTPFYSVRFGDNPARAEELLKLCKLENRLFKEDDEIQTEVLNNDDVVKAQTIVNISIEDSKNWLYRAVYDY